MREVPSESWKNTKALMRLNLSGNPIKLIRSGAFQRLQFVTNLALSHCDIETIEKGYISKSCVAKINDLGEANMKNEWFGIDSNFINICQLHNNYDSAFKFLQKIFYLLIPDCI